MRSGSATHDFEIPVQPRHDRPAFLSVRARRTRCSRRNSARRSAIVGKFRRGGRALSVGTASPAQPVGLIFCSTEGAGLQADYSFAADQAVTAGPPPFNGRS